MITPDDNAGYGRLKRWRERNRGLVNMRQREYRRRKKDLPVPVLAEPFNGDSMITLSGASPQDIGGEARESTEMTRPVSGDSRGGQSSSRWEKLDALRKLISGPHVSEERATKPAIYRDDYGRVISEGQWEKLQETKRRAKEGGYSIDEWSQ